MILILKEKISLVFLVCLLLSAAMPSHAIIRPVFLCSDFEHAIVTGSWAVQKVSAVLTSIGFVAYQGLTWLNPAASHPCETPDDKESKNIVSYLTTASSVFTVLSFGSLLLAAYLEHLFLPDILKRGY